MNGLFFWLIPTLWLNIWFCNLDDVELVMVALSEWVSAWVFALNEQEIGIERPTQKEISIALQSHLTFRENIAYIGIWPRTAKELSFPIQAATEWNRDLVAYWRIWSLQDGQFLHFFWQMKKSWSPPLSFLRTIEAHLRDSLIFLRHRTAPNWSYFWGNHIFPDICCVQTEPERNRVWNAFKSLEDNDIALYSHFIKLNFWRFWFQKYQ